MFYLKINFIDLSLMANNSNCKTQTEYCNFSVFIEKSFRNFKKKKKEEMMPIGPWDIQNQTYIVICTVNLKSQALRFY